MSSMNRVFLFVFAVLFTQVTVAAPNPKAVEGGVFKYNLGQQPTTLNPLSSSDLYASRVQGYIVEGLLQRDSDTYEWKPALAESWSISKDGMSFEFTLRDGVKFHNGKLMTAEDVKFSFDAIVDPDNKYKTAHMKPYYENIASCEILAPNKVKFTAKKKYFKNFDTVAGLAIVPVSVYKDTSKKNLKKLNKTIIGTGAYKLSKFKRGKNIILLKNKNWWGNTVASEKGSANYDKILMRFVKDGTIALQRLTKGDIDYNQMSAEEYMKKTKGPKWGKTVTKHKVQNKAPVSYGFIGWNLQEELFKSKNVRVALSHLLDREKMIKKFRFGLAYPATGPLYRQSEYANEKVKPIPFSPKKALSMLRKEGWSDSDKDGVLDKVINGKKRSLSFTILEPNQEFMKYLTIFKEDAKQVGVEVKLKYLEWNSFIKKLDERSFEAVRLGWGGGSVDWDPKQIWHSSSIKGGSNFISYNNPEVDSMIDTARETLDKAKRKAILKKVFKTIADDAPYSFFFNDKYYFYGKTKRMMNEKETYQYDVGYGRWWIKK